MDRNSSPAEPLPAQPEWLHRFNQDNPTAWAIQGVKLVAPQQALEQLKRMALPPRP